MHKLELKKRVASSYWGCPFQFYESGTESHVGDTSDWDRYIDHPGFRLLVKPLSSITDDHGFDLCGILETPNPDNFIKGFTKRNYVLRTDKCLTAIQYLQSKGYALPYLGYSVEDLVKAGIYKLTQ